MKLIPYVCCGDPDIEFTKKLIRIFSRKCETIEIGIPFSDPIADGRTIQEASQRALENGMNTNKAFAMIKDLRTEGIKAKIILMTYFNIINAYGKVEFLDKMNETGANGIIIPDLPFNEDIEFEEQAKQKKIIIINLVAPNTSEERARRIIENSTGYVYLISSYGTTGTRDKINPNSIEFVKRLRKIAGNKKLFVGFGVSSKEQAKAFENAGADGVIIGSAIINCYFGLLDNRENAVKAVQGFAENFK